MVNPYKIKILEIEQKFILLDIDPAFPNLSKDDVELTCNDNKINNYTLKDESGGSGAIYKIIPDIPFDLDDYITFQIIKTGYLSDKIKIYLCRDFRDGTADLEFKFPNQTSGEYKIKLMTLNGRQFDVSSETITVSLDLKIESCDAVLEGSGTYQVDEEVFVDVELYAIDDEHVPDGLYQIELRAEAG